VIAPVKPPLPDVPVLSRQLLYAPSQLIIENMLELFEMILNMAFELQEKQPRVGPYTRISLLPSLPESNIPMLAPASYLAVQHNAHFRRSWIVFCVA